MRRRVFAAVSAVFLLAGGVATAQTSGADEAAARERRRADKRVVVANNLQLSEGEAKVFWPIYDSHQARLSALNDRTVRMIERYAAALRGAGGDDVLASSLIREMGEIADEEHRMTRALLSEVPKVLSPVKAARYLQIENKIRAGERSYIAESVPLVGLPGGR